jgi:Flp pilus assembly protein TadG
MMSYPKAGSSRRRRRGRGQALTEFALVIPVFLLVLSGILDFGFMLYSRMTVINAAREGARAAVDATAEGQIPTAATSTAGAAASKAGLTVSSVSTSCIPNNPTTASPCTWTAHSPLNLNGVQQGDFISVTVDYTYKTFFPLLFGKTFDLSSTVQMVRE